MRRKEENKEGGGEREARDNRTNRGRGRVEEGDFTTRGTDRNTDTNTDGCGQNNYRGRRSHPSLLAFPALEAAHIEKATLDRVRDSWEDLNMHSPIMGAPPPGSTKNALCGIAPFGAQVRRVKKEEERHVEEGGGES